MKKSRCYKINENVLDMIEQVREQLGINATNFIEMAVIEKYSKLGLFLNESKDMTIYIKKLETSLEKAKNKLK